ncbi:bifunctional 2-polyprenyl-6-hydroxyphenol methylase/3-demethylubiquinol 3-O-methyltransferase UbiG [Nostoc sp. PCC 7107]|uniref:class I SAM-dependent methyltransferase n=1 Tax=Nostoc sp. PCC 7107 TaxID=317936 RepID=UPI00029F4393|nr:class I SAM-dependent methyltransferase [Nostoc sp. PCC 7107]AFY43911.1 Methyltransferase type 11 [Nostoc sp. PCC 7107]
MQITSNPYLWNQVWSQSTEKNMTEFWQWVKRESNSIRGKKIQNYIHTCIGDIDKLKTIEVGSGLGIYSFIFATLGADVTLLDYSEQALDLAQQCFRSNNLKAKFLLQDALNLNPNIHGQYNVAMSFGTVEHFLYPERLKMIESHINLVREGGIIAISVPNIAFLPHEILKAYLQHQKKWYLGYEGAFSRHELFQLANSLKLSNLKVIGSAFLSDFQRYIQIYRSTNFAQKLFGSSVAKSQIIERASFLDNFCGADLVLLGTKKTDEY